MTVVWTVMSSQQTPSLSAACPTEWAPIMRRSMFPLREHRPRLSPRWLSSNGNQRCSDQNGKEFEVIFLRLNPLNMEHCPNSIYILMLWWVSWRCPQTSTQEWKSLRNYELFMSIQTCWNCSQIFKIRKQWCALFCMPDLLFWDIVLNAFDATCRVYI